MKELDKLHDLNMSIAMKINDSVEPMNSEKTALFQQYMNNYMYGDKVLDVDGMWGPNTQKAFNEWKSWSRMIGNLTSPPDLTIGPKLYDIRTSKRTPEQKTMAIDSLYRSKQSIPMHKK